MSEENQHLIFEPKLSQNYFFISHWKRIYISREPHYNHNSNLNNNDHDSNNTTTSITINNNVETIHKEGTMIYMDSLNPDIPIKLERVLWDGTRLWEFMFQSFNFSNMYGKQRDMNEEIKSVLGGNGHVDVDGGSFLFGKYSNTIDENKDVNLYDKFSVLICGILDNEVYSQYLHENNIKSLDITQNQVYGKKYQSHVLCLTNNINKLNNDADYDCNQFNYVLYCIDKQSRVESYNGIRTSDTIIIAINQ